MERVGRGEKIGKGLLVVHLDKQGKLCVLLHPMVTSDNSCVLYISKS
jgi:hypothetical protein